LVCTTAGKEIEKACQGIYPLQNTFIRKVKILRAPKFDITKLMEVKSFSLSSLHSLVSYQHVTCVSEFEQVKPDLCNAPQFCMELCGTYELLHSPESGFQALRFRTAQSQDQCS